MTEIKQDVEQAATAAKAAVETEVAKKVNTFGNTLKDTAGKVAIALVGVVALAVVIMIVLH